MGWLDKYADGGKVLLQPDSPKLPKGTKIPYRDQSSELATSIGGENGEPAYLIPSFKYGRPLSSPLEEYRETNEILGGPFKTWQDADKWEQDVRHPYVEKGQKLPSPLKWWNMKNGGEVVKKVVYNTINPTADFPDTFTNFLDMFGRSKDKTSDAAWAKRLDQPYDENYLPSNIDGSVRLPDDVVSQIEIDTVAVKNKRNQYQNILNSIDYSQDSKMNAEKNLTLIDGYLGSLRKAYKGEPATVSEFVARKGAFDDYGYINQDITPLNVLSNFTLKYNPATKQMEYNDTYDFIKGRGNGINLFEKLTPGKPFEIKGVVPKKKNGGIVPLQNITKFTPIKKQPAGWLDKY